jgi:arsenite-transporting ATPase
VSRIVSPLLGGVTDLPVAGDETFAALRRFYDRLDGVKDLLSDAEVTSVRLVVNPERMVIAEARRTATYLSLFGYRVDAVVANRLLPDSVSDPWFEEWKRLHAEHLHTIEEGFAPLPVLRAELAPHELVGVDRLRQFASALYGDQDPSSRLSDGDALSYVRTSAGTTLRLDLPFADREDLELGRRNDELLVRIGPYRRAILLPDSLHRRRISDATLQKGRLTVVFSEETSP